MVGTKTQLYFLTLNYIVYLSYKPIYIVLLHFLCIFPFKSTFTKFISLKKISKDKCLKEQVFWVIFPSIAVGKRTDHHGFWVGGQAFPWVTLPHMFGDRGNWKLYLWMMLEEGHSSSALDGEYLLDTFCTTTVMIPPMNPVAWKTPTTALTQVTHEGIILNYLLCLSTHFLHGVTSCTLEAVLWLLWGTDCAFWSWQILCANVC